MSYILDALRRADAERGRGTVPGLHARQLPSSGNAAPTGSQNRVWWLTAATVGLVVLAGLWVWRTPAHELSVTAAVPIAVAPLSTAAPVPVPVAVAPVPAPLASAVTPPAVTPTPPEPRPATLPSHTANAQTAAKPNAAAPATPSSAAPVAPVAPAVLPLLSELPDALRRQLPALSITGAVYADDPKQRLLLVNNQVLPQGSQVAPEVMLEEIHQRSSVFNFRGTRFRLAH
jgi:general secretion pathway protein B